jgi:hypothetical protein
LVDHNIDELREALDSFGYLQQILNEQIWIRYWFGAKHMAVKDGLITKLVSSYDRILDPLLGMALSLQRNAARARQKRFFTKCSYQVRIFN